MRLDSEAHGNDLEHHFTTEYGQEDKVKDFNDRVWLLERGVLDSQTDAVGEDRDQDQLVKPGIKDDLHDSTSETTRGRTATQRRVREVLRLVLLDRLRQILLLDDRLGQFLVVASHLSQYYKQTTVS